MEDIITDINDPNVVLETITTRQAYLNVMHPERSAEKTLAKNQPKTSGRSRQ
jgi:hypothetical protein